MYGSNTGCSGQRPPEDARLPKNFRTSDPAERRGHSEQFSIGQQNGQRPPEKTRLSENFHTSDPAERRDHLEAASYMKKFHLPYPYPADTVFFCTQNKKRTFVCFFRKNQALRGKKIAFSYCNFHFIAL